MRKIVWGCAAAMFAAQSVCAATVSVSAFKGTVYGPGEATLAFAGVDAAQEVWVAWDEADKGADFAQWAENERLGTISAGAASATYTLPPDARMGRAARFFLFPANGSYAVAYIRSTGTQYVNTGVYPDPTIAVTAEFMMDDLYTKQQRPFGVADNAFTLAAYINGSGYWAWAAKDDSGNWTSANQTPVHKRTTITIDVPNDLYKVSVPGLPDYTKVMTSESKVKDHQTKTGTLPLFLMAYSTKADGTGSAGRGAMRFYGAAISFAGVPSRDFTPYVQAGEAGLMDTVNSQFYGNAGTGEFYPGGRVDATGAVASDAFDLTEARNEDVFADAYIWMRGMGVDKNGNGILDNGELTNSLNTVALSSTAYGATGHRPVFTNELVSLPGRGVKRMMQTLYFPQDIVYADEAKTNGTVYPCSAHAGTPLTDFDSNYTFYLRIRPDFTTAFGNPQWILGFGYGASRGLMLGFGGKSGDGRTINVYTAKGTAGTADASWNSGLVVSNSWGWIDLAVTVDGQQLTMYVAREWEKSPASVEGALKKAVRNYAADVNLAPNPGTVLRLCTESHQNGSYAFPLASSLSPYNMFKNFRGSIQQLAVWKRALTEQEVVAAMGWPRADLWRVGVENDATTEFSGAAPAEGVAVDGESWPVPQALGAGASVTFRFPLTENLDDLVSQVFRWKATGDSGEGMLGVSVNGTSLGARKVKAGAWQQWFVPGALLHDGTNTLTATRIDGGAGALRFDSAVLGGGWHIGQKGNGWSELASEGLVPADYHVANGVWRNFARVVLPKGTGNKAKSHQWWHAVMPRALAGRYDWTLHVTTGNYEGAAGSRLCIDINGVRAVTKDAPGAYKSWEFPIPGDLLKAGENVFEVYNDTQSGSSYIAFDAIQLEPVAPPSGTFLLVR